MPLVKYEHRVFPAWCEVKFYEILEFDPGIEKTITKEHPKEKVFVGRGECKLAVDGKEIDLHYGDSFNITGDEYTIKPLVQQPLLIIRIAGSWGEETGSSGVFELYRSERPGNTGDPVNYPRNTDFDNHFHDMDEYWIIFGGSGVAVSEMNIFKVQKGDCVVTRQGCHHDFPLVFEKIHGVYFETSLSGQKRLGHLWEHTNKES